MKIKKFLNTPGPITYYKRHNDESFYHKGPYGTLLDMFPTDTHDSPYHQEWNWIDSTGKEYNSYTSELAKLKKELEDNSVKAPDDWLTSLTTKMPNVLDTGKEFHYDNPSDYRSSFDRTAIWEPAHEGLELIGKGFNYLTDKTGTTGAALTILPWLMPSQYVGWIRTGYRPGTEGNTGFGEDKDSQYLNEMFDIFVSPSAIKGVKGVTGTAGRAALATKTGQTISTALKNGATTVGNAVKSSAQKIFKYPDNTKIFKETDWLTNRDSFSGPEGTWASKDMIGAFVKSKLEAKNYFHGEEFKKRVMNSGKFTEEEYLQLLNEIDDHLNKTVLTSVDRAKSGAQNSSLSNGTFAVSLHPTHSRVQMIGNIWHEIMHSIGGKKHVNPKYPMLTRLKEFNESILPKEFSESFLRLYTGRNLAREVRKADPNWISRVVNSGINAIPSQLGYKVSWLVNNIPLFKWIKNNIKQAKWLKKEIANKPREFRSRLSTTLLRMRHLGYDTSKLVDDPSLFSKWVQEIADKNTHMPWDFNQLLALYGSKNLELPASKILSTSGGFYLGNQMLNSGINYINNE